MILKKQRASIESSRRDSLDYFIFDDYNYFYYNDVEGIICKIITLFICVWFCLCK